jgi:uncharacterized membrane protein YoaK (UPF0700 family)
MKFVATTGCVLTALNFMTKGLVYESQNLFSQDWQWIWLVCAALWAFAAVQVWRTLEERS